MGAADSVTFSRSSLHAPTAQAGINDGHGHGAAPSVPKPSAAVQADAYIEPNPVGRGAAAGKVPATASSQATLEAHFSDLRAALARARAARSAASVGQTAAAWLAGAAAAGTVFAYAAGIVVSPWLVGLLSTGVVLLLALHHVAAQRLAEADAGYRTARDRLDGAMDCHFYCLAPAANEGRAGTPSVSTHGCGLQVPTARAIQPPRV